MDEALTEGVFDWTEVPRAACERVDSGSLIAIGVPRDDRWVLRIASG